MHAPRDLSENPVAACVAGQDSPMTSMNPYLDDAFWLPKRAAAKIVGVSTKTIERRAVPWTDVAPQGPRVRFKLLHLGGQPVPRFYGPDIRSWLKNPPAAVAHTTRRLTE